MNIEHDYLKLLNDIMTNGIEKSDRTGTGTLSVFGRQIRHKMANGFPLLTTKKMPFRVIATELIWFLRGDTNIKYLVDNGCHIWDGDAYKNYASKTSMDADGQLTQEEFINKIKTDDDFAKRWGNLGPIYGKQWRSWGRKNVVNYDLKNVKSSDKVKVMDLIRDGGDYSKYDVKVTYQNNSIDQIANLIQDLKSNPDSRRLMVSAWNVGELDQMTLPPCHYGFQVYTRELTFKERWSLYSKTPYDGNVIGLMNTLDYLDDKNIPTRAISLMWNQRSVDMPLGLPFNIASYALLLELLAMEVNMVADELIGNLGDCHIYLDQRDGVREQLTREPMSLGKLSINTEFWNPDSNVFDQQDIRPTDFQVLGYESHPAIKFPLSN